MKKTEMNGYATLRSASMKAVVHPDIVLSMAANGIIPYKIYRGNVYVEVEPLVNYIKQHQEKTIMFGDRPYIDVDGLYKVFDGNEPNGLPHATWFGKDRSFIDLHAAHEYLDKLVSELKEQSKDTNKNS